MRVQLSIMQPIARSPTVGLGRELRGGKVKVMD